MEYNAAVTRIAHDLCVLLDDDWSEGHKLYLAQAQMIYDREIKPLRNFLVLIVAEIEEIRDPKTAAYVLGKRLSGLTTNAKLKLTELKTSKGATS